MNITDAIRNTKRAVIPYVTAGLPDIKTTGKIIKALSDAGAAAIEIGIPFSDPMADGPVLQKASKMALDAGFKMDALFERLPEWSSNISIPLIVMSYINPLMHRGIEATLKKLKSSGIAGVIIPDEPSDASELFNLTRSTGLDLIRLVAPTTALERREEVVSQCSGFIYAVSVKGVTGARKALPEEVQTQVAQLRSLSDLPVCVGFGVSSKEQVDGILRFADGVIIGSYLMERIMNSDDSVKEAGELIKGFTRI
jgi:tryptophan synthase alpha chain